MNVEEGEKAMKSKHRRSHVHNMLIKEHCKEQEDRLRKESPFGQLKSWKLFRLIVKSNDDVRQEQFAM